MAKQRVSIPKAIGEKVLKEYHHKCAVCGRHEPQLHHLDENPANNDPLNLLPLCPNCHLQDTHDPTSPPDPRKLKLFRRYKDPAILDPRFQPIFTRMVFLSGVAVLNRSPTNSSHGARVNELLDFIAELQMGTFYRKKIRELINHPTGEYERMLVRENGKVSQFQDAAYEEAASAYCKEQIELLIVEMLRYQDWNQRAHGRTRASSDT